MRIMVVGSPGSGKSTLSKELGKLLSLPVYHLDKYFWKKDWVASERKEWEEVQKTLVAEENWIIDGHYGSTAEIRIKRANIALIFDMPSIMNLCRVIKRRIKYQGKNRPDLKEGCPERLDMAFLRYTWRFRKKNLPRMEEKLNDAPGLKVISFQKLSCVEQFLQFVKQYGEAAFELYDDKEGGL